MNRISIFDPSNEKLGRSFPFIPFFHSFPSKEADWSGNFLARWERVRSFEDGFSELHLHWSSCISGQWETLKGVRALGVFIRVNNAHNKNIFQCWHEYSQIVNITLWKTTIFYFTCQGHLVKSISASQRQMLLEKRNHQHPKIRGKLAKVKR